MQRYVGKHRSMMCAALLAALTAALSFVVIPLPFSPVPVTGQTFGVMLAGALLGAKWGAASQLVYLALGALGLPVFAGGNAGFGSLVGPAGGYLWGFVAGAFVTGIIVRGGIHRTTLRTVLGLAVGSVGVVYLLGAAQLVLVTGVTLGQALLVGVLPFLPGDVFKLVVTVLLVHALESNKVYQEIRDRAGI